MVWNGRRTHQAFHKYHLNLSVFKKIYFLFNIFFRSFFSKPAVVKPILILVSERYFSFFRDELNPPGSVFIVYIRNSNEIRVTDGKERNFYVYLTEKKGIKKLADYLIGHRFSHAIVFSDEDYEHFAPFFQFIRADHRICLNKNQSGLKSPRSDCMIEINLGPDDGNNREKIRYYFKNLFGIAG